MPLNKHDVLALIYLPKWHLESEELNLAYEMLKKSLMAFCDIQISHDPISDDFLHRILLEQTNYRQGIIVNSGSLLSPQWLEASQDHWQKSKTDSALIFSSLSDHADQEPYFTLYGFNQYCLESAQNKRTRQADTLIYDNRDIHAITFLWAQLKQFETQGRDNLLQSLHSEAVIFRSIQCHFFGHYYSGLREDILALLPQQINSLLDIGCGTGEFACQVKERLHLRVDGIEANEHQACLARQKLDHVYSGDANQLELDQRYDFITCLDMIEHLPNPEALLKKISSQWLNKKGHLLISIPNIAHWSIIEELLAGEFNYIPAGLLCNTHRRFYTRKSMIELLESCGFKIIQIIPEMTYIPDRIKNSIERISDIMKVDQESLQTHDYKILAASD